MGLFKKLFGKKTFDFTVDTSLTEYENLLNFIDAGGSSEQWEYLKVVNNWKFAKWEFEEFERYLEILKPASDAYYAGMKKIQSGWSILYNSKSFTGPAADQYIVECYENIALYKLMSSIEIKHGKKPPENVPAYKRLAMIYEKRGQFKQSANICTEALLNGAYGDGMTNRFIRMLKKSGKEPSHEERELIYKLTENNK